MSEAAKISVEMDLKLGRLETEVSRTLTKFGTQLEAQLKRAETRIISFSAIAGTLYTVQTGFTNLIKSTMEVEKALTDVNVIANTSSRELKKFGNELFNIAKDTNQAFSTVTTAAIELSRQGLGLQETLKRTKDAMILTQLSGLSANDAIETLSATINSFNKELITSTDIVNKFAAVDAKFAVSSADLANAVKRVGASAQEAGVGLDELIGLVTAAQQTTARGGAVIGNSIKTIFTRIERPKVIDQLEEMQIKTRDLNGELLPATQILTNLSLAYDKLSQSEKSHTAELVGGIYQINLLKATLSDLEKKGNSVSAKAMGISQNSQDVAYARSVELNKTMESQVNRLMLNLKQVGAGAGAKTNLGDTTVGFVIKSINNVLDNDAESGGESVGNKIAQGIISGITKTLFNQGAAMFGLYFLRIVKDLTQQLSNMTGGLYSGITGNVSQIEKAAAVQTLVADAVAKTDNNLLRELESRKAIADQIIKAIELEGQRQKMVSLVTQDLLTGERRVGFSSSKGFYTKSVPNAADPIRSAIQREISSGVPASSISVGTHPALVNANNPQGFGVYNSIDEPKGISQGISRAYSEGRNPQNYNVPNFSNGPYDYLLRPLTLSEPQPPSSITSIPSIKPKNVDKDVTTLMGMVVTDAFNRAKIESNPSQIPLLKPKNIDKDVTTLMGMMITDAFNRAKIENNPSQIPLLSNKTSTYEQWDKVNFGVYNPALSFLRKTQNKIYESEINQKAIQTPELQTVNKIPYSEALYNLRQEQIKAKSGGVNIMSQPPNQSFFSKMMDKTSGLFTNENINKTFNVGLGASIFANSAASMIGTDTKEARIASGITSTLGDTVSNGILAGMVTKSPQVALGTAAGTLIMGLTKAFQDFTDPLPDLIKTLDDSKEKISKMEAGFTNFMRISDLLSDPEGKLSDKQRFRLTNERQAALSNFAPEDRAKLYEAIVKGSPAEASRIYSELSTGPVNKKIFDELAAFITGQKKEGIFNINKTRLIPNQFGDLIQENYNDITPKTKKAEETMRAFINSLTTKEGASIETLLTENPELRQQIFGRLKYGNTRSALALALQATGVDDQKREDLLSQIDQSGEDFSKYFYNNFFTGNLSQGMLEKSSELTRNMPKDINNEKLRKFNMGLAAYNRKTGYDRFDLERSRQAEVMLNKIGFGTELADLTDEVELAKLKSRQSLERLKAEPTMTQAAFPEFDYKQRVAYLNQQTLAQESAIEGKRTDDLLKNKLQSQNQYSDLINPILNQYYTAESGRAQGLTESASKTTMTNLYQNFGNLKTMLKKPSEMKDYVIGELDKITGDIQQNPSLLNADKSLMEYQKTLRDILSTINSIGEKEKENAQKISDNADQSIVKLGKQTNLQEELLELEKQLGKIQQENASKLNTAQLLLNLDTEGKLSVQKYGFARSRYAGGYLSTDELNAARTSAMESYRGAYGINKNLENANIYESFRSQFDYNTTDRFKEMERSAVELGSTMKSSFADAFKSFSLGAKSAGNAFRDFGMSILDKITSITSNISTNLLFNSIGSLMPSSGFAKLFSAPGLYSSGGLVTGGSGTRDDVPAALAPGDFVMRRAAVEKYGQGFMASLNNSYDYNDAKYPTAGNLNVDPRLSVAALEDENNPQNALRKSREENLVSYIKEKEQYDLQKKNAMSAYRSAQNQRLIGAYLSAGIMAAGAGIKGSFGGAKDSFGNKIPTGGYTYSNPNAYSQPYMNTELRGFAIGGSVNGSGSADTVPALLTGGEYVLNRAAVNKIGLPTLENINALRYASGGLVGSGTITNNQTDESTLSALLQSINALKQSIDTSKQQPNKTNDGGGITNYISVNVTSSGGEPKSDVSINQKGKSDSTTGSTPTVDDMKKLGNLIKNVVYEVVLQESKPGGLIQKQV